MAPLVLKIKGNKTFLPFSTLTSEDELSQTWRVCTKVKDSLENGSRLENLSWRLWFRQHVLNEKGSFKKLSITTARKLSSHVKLVPITPTVKEEPVMYTPLQIEPLLDTTFFDTPQQQQQDFTLPQTNNEIVALDDIFNAFNNEFNIPQTDMGMADGWDFGIPSPTNPYYSPTEPSLQHPTTTTTNLFAGFDQNIPNEGDAMYVSGSTMPPPPTATLRNKLLNQHMRFNSSSQGFNTGSQTPPMSTSNSASTIASTVSVAHMGVLMDDSNV